MILKLLLVGAVIFTVYIMFFKKKSIKEPQKSKASKKKQDTQKINEMIECATCGVYCELDEAILSGSKYYCSAECVNKAS
ncbi:MAG: PP0621 family protein [Sulfurimonas sp.]